MILNFTVTCDLALLVSSVSLLRSAIISIMLFVFRYSFIAYLDHLYLLLFLVYIRAPYSRAVLKVRSYMCEVGRGFCFQLSKKVLANVQNVERVN